LPQVDPDPDPEPDPDPVPWQSSGQLDMLSPGSQTWLPQVSSPPLPSSPLLDMHAVAASAAATRPDHAIAPTVLQEYALTMISLM